jgi:hypothetical protein
VRDVTKFPHATAKIKRRPKERVSPGPAFSRAEMVASNTFVRKYKRLPDYDVVCFRGFVTTTEVVFEIWEEP